jgi:hypothetical protein
MGTSSDQIQREITQVRGSMESKIVELRERSRRQVRRISRAALIAAGTGAAVGVVVVGAIAVYRLTRPASPAERARRLLPRGLAELPLDARHARRQAARRLGSRVPSVRLYIGDRQVGEQPPAPWWDGIVIRAAQAAGTAAAVGLASRLLASLASGQGREAEGGSREAG